LNVICFLKYKFILQSDSYVAQIIGVFQISTLYETLLEMVKIYDDSIQKKIHIFKTFNMNLVQLTWQ